MSHKSVLQGVLHKSSQTWEHSGLWVLSGFFVFCPGSDLVLVSDLVVDYQKWKWNCFWSFEKMFLVAWKLPDSNEEVFETPWCFWDAFHGGFMVFLGVLVLVLLRRKCFSFGNVWLLWVDEKCQRFLHFFFFVLKSWLFFGDPVFAGLPQMPPA